jgi:tetratricopeptide (TPR) repeat protein
LLIVFSFHNLYYTTFWLCPEFRPHNKPRYFMLETIREYALECLEASGESQEIRHRHAIFFLALAETAHCDSPLSIPLLTWLDTIDQDHDNVRVALEWSFRCERTVGLRLAVATIDYWLKRGRVTDGRYWLEKSLEVYHSDEMNLPDLLMDILCYAALLAYFQDDLVTLRQHAEALLTLGRKEEDTKGIRNALFSMGQEALQRQAYERANTVFEEVLALSRPMGITHFTSSALLMLGQAAIGLKDYKRALALNTESLEIYRYLGDKWGEAMVLGAIGLIREQEGNYHEARAFIRQSLRISIELDDKLTLSGNLDHLAGVMSLEGEHQSAARLMGAAEALRDSMAAPVKPLDRSRHDDIMARVHAGLDASTFAAAWAEGRLMTLEQAIEDALSE